MFGVVVALIGGVAATGFGISIGLIWSFGKSPSSLSLFIVDC
jgi:hypothetical protein